MIAPSTFLYSLPTREPHHDVEAANQVVMENKRRGITRVDSLHVEERCREDEEVDEFTGAPLCREADIEKWKNAPVPT
jgi:hypothetical protein